MAMSLQRQSAARMVCALLALAAFAVAQPSLAAGGVGGVGGGHGGGGMGAGGAGRGFGGAHGGSLRIPGHRPGMNGFPFGQRHFRETGSGFGYNGGIFGQGAYLPFNSTRCLVRVNGPGGPGIARVC